MNNKIDITTIHLIIQNDSRIVSLYHYLVASYMSYCILYGKIIHHQNEKTFSKTQRAEKSIGL